MKEAPKNSMEQTPVAGLSANAESSQNGFAILHE
jgi:hypothetical protein